MNNEILKYLMEDAQFTDVINSLYDNEIIKESTTINRRQVLSLTIQIFKTKLKYLKNKYPIKDSIYSKPIDTDEKDKFINNEINHITIAWYDLWKFTTNARDTDKQNEFAKYLKELFNDVNKEISKYNAKISADRGDWDESMIDLVIE